MERLQKILSQAGIASRRASEQLMLEGRVTVNGATVRELGTKADPARDDIRVDGRRIKIAERHRYILLNKPRGYVTTRSDPERRPTVIDLLRGVREYVYPVGRLDFDSEGLLLLTNDGDLAARLTHPRHGVAARVRGARPRRPRRPRSRSGSRGVVIDGQRTGRPTSASLQEHVGAQARIAESAIATPSAGGRPRGARAVTRRSDRTTEGRNRQVRKMCDAIGHPVDRLRRVAIGPIRDARLKPGQWRELTPRGESRAASETATGRRSKPRGP